MNNNQNTCSDEEKVFNRMQDEEAAKEKMKSVFLNSTPLETVNIEKSEEEESTRIKLEINEFVWRNAGDKTTLEQADIIATNFWAAIMETRS